MRRLLILVLLAGCVSSMESASITVEGPGLELGHEQPFDAGTRPTAPLYEARGHEHPGFYTLHDLLFEWADQEGHDLEMEFYDGDFGHGFTLCAIDDVPPREVDGQARGCFERGGFWALSVDGEPADVGMSDVRVRDGEDFTLTWTTFQ